MIRPLGERGLRLLLAAITALGPIATNLYLPALPAVRDHFGASVAAVQSTFSVSLVTFAIGLLVWGPISDRWGRRTAILAGLGIMMAGATLSILAPDLHWLVVGRGLQAFGTATGLVTARAIVVDRHPADGMAKQLASLTMVSVLANSLAPVAGGYLVEWFDWRSVFVALLAATGAVVWFVWRSLPETRATGRTPPRGREMLATVGRLARQPLFVGCVLQCAAIYATFLVFISLLPYVMVSALHRPGTEFGYYYLFIGGGYFLGNWSVGRYALRRDPHWMVVLGIGLTASGSAAALVFAWLGFAHPLAIFLPIAVLAYGQGLALPNVTAAAVSLTPHHAGVASSLVGFLQQMVGAACVQWMGHYPTDTALPMLTFCAVTCSFACAALRFFPRVIPARVPRALEPGVP
ncbi:MAG: multidrug effflux MFS transporter [Steroidobacteraceae bacterium]